MDSRPVDPALIADPDFAAGFASVPTDKVPPVSEVLRMRGLCYMTAHYSLMRDTEPDRSDAFLQGVCCALCFVKCKTPVPLIPGPPVAEGLTLLYVAPDERRSGFLITDVIARYGRRFAQIDNGAKCPLSALTVLGHLPISIKEL